MQLEFLNKFIVFNNGLNHEIKIDLRHVEKLLKAKSFYPGQGTDTLQVDLK